MRCAFRRETKDRVALITAFSLSELTSFPENVQPGRMKQRTAIPDNHDQDRPTAFVERHYRWILSGILLLAALFRIAYFVQAVDGPLAVMHRWDQTDMNYYDL